MANEGTPVKVAILGINRSGSASSIEDGSCNEVIGLEYKDGCLVPFEPVKTLCDVTGYDRVWIHKTSHQTNYIYLEGRNLLWQSESEALSGAKNLKLIAQLKDNVKQIDFINNILCYNKTTHLFKDGEYRMLALQDVDFKMNIGATGNGVAVMYDGVLGEKDSVNSQSLNKFASDMGLIERVNTNFQILEGEVKRGDYISGACFLRYAIKLYDGSYINTSEPVLFLPDSYYELNGYSYNNPMKFGLRGSDFVSSGDIVGLSNPPANFIPPFVGSTMFWSMIPYYDAGKGQVTGKFNEAFSLLNSAIENRQPYGLSADGVADSWYWQFVYPHTFHDKTSKYQRPTMDYYSLTKGAVGFRERLQFNSTTFNKDWYYKYDKRRDVLTYDYDMYKEFTTEEVANAIAWGGDVSLSGKTRGRGWTWGVLPSVVGYLKREQMNGLADGVKYDVCAMTLPIESFGQRSAVSHSEVWFDENKLHESGSRFKASNLNWFSTIHGLTENDNWGNLLDRPSNYHLGEMGFCVWNTSYFEGIASSLDSNVNMVFGRELYTPMYEIVNNVPEEYKDLIIGVDLFMSRPISMHEDYQGETVFTNLGAHRPYKAKHELAAELEKNFDSFYKIHSISFDELIKHLPNKTVIPYIERGKIASLENQIRLVEYGRNTFDYDVSYLYNAKLHIAKITETLFGGYNDSTAQFPSTGYNWAEHADSKPQQRLVAHNAQIETRRNLLISTFGLKDKINLYKFNIIGKIKIKIDDIVEEFKFKKEIRWEDEYPFNLSFLYPDFRAESVQIDGIEISNTLFPQTVFVSISKSIELIADEVSNLAFNLMFSKDNSFSNAKLSTLEFYETSPTPNSMIKKERDMNIFKASATNNPLVYPYSQTYRVGYGKIIGFSSNAVALSQGQYGLYPLYVFTDSGIFAMKVDASFVGTYSDSTPISREVCNNPNSIVQVDGGVFFSSDKGLMLLSGTEATLFSQGINGEPSGTPDKESTIIGDGLKVYANAVDNVNLVTLYGSVSHEDFREYISNQGTHISYIYEKNKLLVYNKDYDYSYMIDLSSAVCTKIAKSIAFDTKNYPSSLYGILSGTKRFLYKMPIDGAEIANETLIQTRPIKLSPDVIKSSYRVVLRGIFHGEPNKYSGIYVLGSLDGEKWMYMGGAERKHLDGVPVKDIGTTIERNSCKFLTVIYVGSLLPETKIENIEITTSEKYNDKTR